MRISWWNPLHCGVKIRKIAMSKTSENWFGLVNSCIYYARRIREIYPLLPHSMDFKAPGELQQEIGLSEDTFTIFETQTWLPDFFMGINPFRGFFHYNDVIMSAMASQITSLTMVYSTVYSGTDQRKHQSSASLAFVQGIHRWPVNTPHKWPVARKMFPFDVSIMLPDRFG